MAMKLKTLLSSAIITAASLSIPLLGVAQSELLSLKHGVYVEKQQSCKGAPSAAIMVWDGIAFTGAHSGRCNSRVLRRDKTHFQVSTACSALGDGSPSAVGSDYVDSFLLTRLSSPDFVLLRDRQDPRSFRWCSVKNVD